MRAHAHGPLMTNAMPYRGCAGSARAATAACRRASATPTASTSASLCWRPHTGAQKRQRAALQARTEEEPSTGDGGAEGHAADHDAETSVSREGRTRWVGTDYGGAAGVGAAHMGSGERVAYSGMAARRRAVIAAAALYEDDDQSTPRSGIEGQRLYDWGSDPVPQPEPSHLASVHRAHQCDYDYYGSDPVPQPQPQLQPKLARAEAEPQREYDWGSDPVPWPQAQPQPQPQPGGAEALHGYNYDWGSDPVPTPEPHPTSVEFRRYYDWTAPTPMAALGAAPQAVPEADIVDAERLYDWGTDPVPEPEIESNQFERSDGYADYDWGSDPVPTPEPHPTSVEFPRYDYDWGADPAPEPEPQHGWRGSNVVSAAEAKRREAVDRRRTAEREWLAQRERAEAAGDPDEAGLVPRLSEAAVNQRHITNAKRLAASARKLAAEARRTVLEAQQQRATDSLRRDEPAKRRAVAIAERFADLAAVEAGDVVDVEADEVEVVEADEVLQPSNSGSAASGRTSADDIPHTWTERMGTEELDSLHSTLVLSDSVVHTAAGSRAPPWRLVRPVPTLSTGVSAVSTLTWERGTGAERQVMEGILVRGREAFILNATVDGGETWMLVEGAAGLDHIDLPEWLSGSSARPAWGLHRHKASDGSYTVQVGLFPASDSLLEGLTAGDDHDDTGPTGVRAKWLSHALSVASPVKSGMVSHPLSLPAPGQAPAARPSWAVEMMQQAKERARQHVPLPSAPAAAPIAEADAAGATRQQAEVRAAAERVAVERAAAERAEAAHAALMAEVEAAAREAEAAASAREAEAERRHALLVAEFRSAAHAAEAERDSALVRAQSAEADAELLRAKLVSSEQKHGLKLAALEAGRRGSEARRLAAEQQHRHELALAEARALSAEQRYAAAEQRLAAAEAEAAAAKRRHERRVEYLEAQQRAAAQRHEHRAAVAGARSARQLAAGWGIPGRPSSLKRLAANAQRLAAQARENVLLTQRRRRGHEPVHGRIEEEDVARRAAEEAELKAEMAQLATADALRMANDAADALTNEAEAVVAAHAAAAATAAALRRDNTADTLQE